MLRRLPFVLVLILVWATPVLAEPDAGTTSPDAAVTKAEKPKKAEDAKAPDKKAEEPKKEQPVGPPHKQPENTLEAFETVSMLIDAAKSGYWGIFAGLLIMLLIYVLKDLVGIIKRVPPKAVPWVAAGLGILAAIAAELSTGTYWGEALLHGFTAGATAVGLWELIFKHFLKKKSEPAEG